MNLEIEHTHNKRELASALARSASSGQARPLGEWSSMARAAGRLAGETRGVVLKAIRQAVAAEHGERAAAIVARFGELVGGFGQ
jgi:phage tail tape-measure protein